MGNIDKRGRLGEEIFSYQISKDQTVFLSWKGKVIKTLKGKQAAKFIERIETAGSAHDEQLIMAKATGNFKR